MLIPLQEELRPRLCHMKKGPNGYGFNLHSEKSRPGQFIRSVDPDSPASRSGLRPQDRLVEVMVQGASGISLMCSKDVQSCLAGFCPLLAEVMGDPLEASC